MTAEEVVDLIRVKEGNLCGRYYQRADGTILTSQCPIGAARPWQLLKRALGTFSAALVAFCATVWAGNRAEKSRQTPPSQLSRQFAEATEKAKSAIGIAPTSKPTIVVAGAICVVPNTNTPRLLGKISHPLPPKNEPKSVQQNPTKK
jgi:hypothetical protein